MDTASLIYAALILLGASFVQAMIGFAFNLLAIPLLIWSGFSLGQSIAITAIPILIQLLISAFKQRRSLVADDLALGIGVRFVTLPIGIMLLYTLDQLDPNTIKPFVGAVLLLIVLSEWFVHFVPRAHLGRGWDLLAFGMSGLMLGVIGMGGPPIVLWLMAHDWPPKRSRAFVTWLFLASAPIQIGLLYWKLDETALKGFAIGTALLPIVIVGTLLGNWIGDRFDEKRFKQIVHLFLLLTALISIVSPLL